MRVWRRSSVAEGNDLMNSGCRDDFLDRTVGELVAEDYTRGAAFTRVGIDFCCGGGRTVAEACREAGVSSEERVGLLDALDALDASGAEPASADARSWSLGQLVRHIEERHHAYLRRTLPVLDAWTDKIARVHGKTHPELVEVRTLVGDLGGELVRHMREEEDEIFPLIASLDAPADDDAVGLPVPVPDSVVEALEDDHEHAGALTRRIRELTDGFSPPPGACATYSATFALLEEFEVDLHRHVHLENNVLFPRARALNGTRSEDADAEPGRDAPVG